MTNELGLDAVARLVEFAHHNRLFSVVSGIRLRLQQYVVLQRAIVIPDYNGARHVITGRQMINFQNDISFHNRKTDLQPAPPPVFCNKRKAWACRLIQADKVLANLRMLNKQQPTLYLTV